MTDGPLKTFRPNWIPRRLPPKARPVDHGQGDGGDPSRAFYNSRPWKDLRDLKRKLNPLCEVCLTRGVVKPVAVVHHLEHVRDNPDRALDLTNLQSVCKACHARVHPEKGRAK